MSFEDNFAEASPKFGNVLQFYSSAIIFNLSEIAQFLADYNQSSFVNVEIDHSDALLY